MAMQWFISVAKGTRSRFVGIIQGSCGGSIVCKSVAVECCRRLTGAGYTVLSMPPNCGRLMLAEIGPVWTVLIGSSKDGARTFIMPCTVGVHAEKFTILGGCSLQWQGHHSPTSNYIEGPVATDNRMMTERAISRQITRKPSCLISIHHPGPDDEWAVGRRVRGMLQSYHEHGISRLRDVC